LDNVFEALKQIQECIHELRRDVESLQDDGGIQIGNSTFDCMDSAIKELKQSIKPEDWPEEPEEFGRYLRWIRKRKGLTIVKLSELSGVSHPYISQLETESRIPSVKVLRTLAPYLGVKYYELLLKADFINEDELLEILTNYKKGEM
jgi:ribosome-binding protein aMBF1 (putative translation factor)